MDDHEVIAERDGVRVIAEPDRWPHQPEHQGWPEVIIGWDRGWSTYTESWRGITDEDAIMRALHEFDNDERFERWLRIHAVELVNWGPDHLGHLSEDEDRHGLTVKVSTAHGYSQGDEWLVLQWHPANVSDDKYDGDESELVNWARGDAWVLVPQVFDRDSEDWDEAPGFWASCTYFASSPERSDYMTSEAGTLLEDVVTDQMARAVRSAQDYYETLEVTR